MGSKSDTAESNFLKLVFLNTTWARIGDATGLVGAGTVGSLYVSLHTATLSDTSGQTTSEAAYTSYVRTAVARTTGGWTISGTTQVVNAAQVAFVAATGGSETETHFAIGTDSSAGSGHNIYWGALTSSLAVSSGITPSFAASGITITED